MITKIKKGISKKELHSLFLKIEQNKSKQKGFDAHKFCGTVKFNEDALEIQKKLRDEWE